MSLLWKLPKWSGPTVVMLALLVSIFSPVGVQTAEAAGACWKPANGFPTGKSKEFFSKSVSSVPSSAIGVITPMAPEKGQPEWDGADRAQETKLLPGNKVLVAGKFNGYTYQGVNRAYQNLVIIDLKTGAPQSSFNVRIDGEVLTAEVSCTGTAIYIGGNFSNVNGVARKNAAKLNISDGALNSWNPSPNGPVQDIAMIRKHLVVGGSFTTIGGASRSGLASVSQSTGAADGWLNLPVAGVTEPGSTQSVYNVVASPTDTYMVVTGNFLTVDGKKRPRMALVKAGKQNASVTKWKTDKITKSKSCSPNKNHEELGVDISPNGKWFYTVTTGGHQAGATCDATTKWDARDLDDKDSKPVWINFTERDSLSGVVATNNSVFVAGHQKACSALPNSKDNYVERYGLCQISAKTGKVKSWNPTTSRQRSMHVRMAWTPYGLFYAGDANQIGGQKRNNIALFPFSN